MATRFPQVKVELVGQDGNAFAILGRVRKAMQRAGVPKEDRDAFTSEATSGDYNHLLSTVFDYVTVTDGDEEEEDYFDDD